MRRPARITGRRRRRTVAGGHAIILIVVRRPRVAWRGDTTTTHPGRSGHAILLLAIPMVLELCLESVFAVVDVFFVSRLGADAVATVGITESMLIIIYSIAMGLGMGAAAIVARRTGEGDADGASRAAVQAILLGVDRRAADRGRRRDLRADAARADGRVARRAGERVVHDRRARRQRRDHDAVSHQRGVSRRRRRGDCDAGAVDRQRDQYLPRSVPHLRSRAVSGARRHRRRGRDHHRPRDRRAGAVVLPDPAGRTPRDPSRAPPASISA